MLNFNRLRRTVDISICSKVNPPSKPSASIRPHCSSRPSRSSCRPPPTAFWHMPPWYTACTASAWRKETPTSLPRSRTNLTCYIQISGISSLLLCVLTMFLIYVELLLVVWVFATALLLLMVSLLALLNWATQIAAGTLGLHLKHIEAQWKGKLRVWRPQCASLLLAFGLYPWPQWACCNLVLKPGCLPLGNSNRFIQYQYHLHMIRDDHNCPPKPWVGRHPIQQTENDATFHA